MERTITEVRRGAAPGADLAYWLSRPMAERVAAVEALRQQAMGAKATEHAEPRLQRVCRITQRVRG
ncbi:MAG TPA: hypothetical protein PLA97_14720 [Rubrivivax sp.]|nr:hypothetical protein [Rubrivivax sp.]